MRLGTGQSDDEACTANGALSRFDVDITLMPLDDGSGNGKA